MGLYVGMSIDKDVNAYAYEWEGRIENGEIIKLLSSLVFYILYCFFTSVQICSIFKKNIRIKIKIK